MILQTKPTECIIKKLERQSSFSWNIYVSYLKGYDKTAFDMSIIYSVFIVLKLLDAWVCDFSKPIYSK